MQDRLETRQRSTLHHPSQLSPASDDARGRAPGGRSVALFDEGFGLRIGGTIYYINLRIGREMRTEERRAAEGQVAVAGSAFLYCVISTAAIMLFGTLCLVYLVKSAFGINLSEGNSVLHPLYSLWAVG